MKLSFFLAAVLSVFLMVNSAFAGCYVENPTFYSKDKYSIMTFGMAMDQGNQKKALSMVDDGRVKACSKASCVVIERLDNGFVHVNIAGIGKAWIYKTFLHCY